MNVRCWTHAGLCLVIAGAACRAREQITAPPAVPPDPPVPISAPADALPPVTATRPPDTGVQADADPLASARERRYTRSMERVAEARYYKPGSSTAEVDDLLIELAPLLLHSVSASNTGNNAGRNDPDAPAGGGIGAVTTTAGRLTVSTRTPVVYAGLSLTAINDEPRQQLIYVWAYADESRDSNVGLQGIRMTLDSYGAPALWEVLRDEDGLRLMFAARSLESAASEAFGDPLPGRRHASEPGLGRYPGVVVARILEDGPQPMGPWVYLAEDQSVLTVLCRCMPSQVDAIAAMTSYELRPLSELTGQMPVAGPVAAAAGHPVPREQPVRAFALTPPDPDSNLEAVLRWPAGF